MPLLINGRFLAQPLTGVQRYGREFVRALDDLMAEGHLEAPEAAVLLTPPLAAPPPPFRSIRHRVVGRVGGHLWEQAVLPRHAGRDVLFCPGNTAPLLRLGRFPTVVTVHDLAHRYFPDAYGPAFRLLYRALTPAVLRRADHVVTVSASERRRILALYPEAAGRLTAVANGAPPVRTDPPPPAPPVPKPYVLSVGALGPRKNPNGLLDALSRIERSPPVHLVLAGPRPRGLVAERLAADPALERRLHLPGPVDDEALDALYAHAACLAFPSFHEASGLPATEAMAAGCPVVASDLPDLRERCADAVFYCDPKDPASIAAALVRVIDDPRLADDLRRRGRARAARFTWRRTVLATLPLLRPAADRGSAPGPGKGLVPCIPGF